MRKIYRPKRVISVKCALPAQEGSVNFTLLRSSHRRTVTISINEKAEVRVSAPFHADEEQVFNFVKEKSAWIFRKQENVRQKMAGLRQRTFEHGGEFLFMGRRNKLEVQEHGISSRPMIHFDGQRWLVSLPVGLTINERLDVIKERMIQWYRQQAEEILGGRVFHFSRIVGAEPQKITIRTQKRLWGSCHFKTQSINLNWQIILSPPEVMDYVVVHELCHLIVPNHSKRFWRMVEKILPDFKRRRQWLRDNHHEVVIS